MGNTTPEDAMSKQSPLRLQLLHRRIFLMPKRTQRFRRTAKRKGRRLSPWLLLGAVPIALGQQIIRRNLRVNNPEIALRHGSKLLAEPRRVLAVARQLDVLEFLAGGTLRLLRLSGSHVTVVVN